MELRQIRGFVEVARTGSFARAAEALHIGKPALSKQIRQLETELGADLFVRGGGRREARMTPAGEAFLPDAVTAIQAVDSGLEQVRRLSGPEGGHVHVMVADGWETWPDWEYLVTAFRQQHPTVGSRIVGSSSVREMLSAVATGACDMAIITYIDEPAGGDARVEPLLSTPLHVYLAPEHPLADAPELTLYDLRDENWLLPPIDRAFMTELMRPMGLVPRVEIEVTNATLIKPLMLAGEGIALSSAVEAAFYEPARPIPLTPEVIGSIAMAYRRGHRPAGTRALRDFLRGVFAGVASV